jgi:hypothetical protein
VAATAFTWRQEVELALWKQLERWSQQALRQQQERWSWQALRQQ